MLESKKYPEQVNCMGAISATLIAISMKTQMLWLTLSPLEGVDPKIENELRQYKPYDTQLDYYLISDSTQTVETHVYKKAGIFRTEIQIWDEETKRLKERLKLPGYGGIPKYSAKKEFVLFT